MSIDKCLVKGMDEENSTEKEKEKDSVKTKCINILLDGMFKKQDERLDKTVLDAIANAILPDNPLGYNNNDDKSTINTLKRKVLCFF